MLTADEIEFAGAINSSNSTYYLNKNATTNYWWALSPSYFDVEFSSVYSFFVSGNGYLDYSYRVYYNCSLRAAVTLSSSTKIISGDGTVNNAYVVK